MNEFIKIQAKLVPVGKTDGISLTVYQQSVLEELRKLSSIDESGVPTVASVKFDLRDSKLITALRLIEEHTGRKANRTEAELNQPDAAKHVYRCTIERTYVQSDIINAPLLRPRGKNTRYELAFTHPGYLMDAPVLRFEYNHRKKTPLPLGWVDCTDNLFCSRSFADLLLKRNKLRGLSFQPAKVGHPLNKPCPELLRLRSSLTVPSLLLPLQTGKGEPYAGGLTADMDSTGCYPAESVVLSQHHYRFDRGAVAAMGEFDIALTQEIIGSWLYSSAMQKLIVSQRFREEMEELKISGLEYIPVYLDSAGNPKREGYCEWDDVWTKAYGQSSKTTL